jgi:protein SCO1/2
MRKQIGVGAAAARLVLAASLSVAACSGDSHDTLPAARDVGPESARTAAQPSIYDLDVSLIDQEGRATSVAGLRGRVLVAAMIYTSCTSVCPRITEDMKGIERQLSRGNLDDVGFVLFSLDPRRDTPGALRRFAEAHGLAASRWRLFATSEDGVRELAAALGVRYSPEAGGEIAHSAMVFVIDRAGVVRHRQEGLQQDPQELMDALAAAGHAPQAR